MLKRPTRVEYILRYRGKQLPDTATLAIGSLEKTRRVLKEVTNYSLLQMTGEIGGHVGMYLGFSFLTLIKLVLRQ